MRVQVELQGSGGKAWDPQGRRVENRLPNHPAPPHITLVIMSSYGLCSSSGGCLSSGRCLGTRGHGEGMRTCPAKGISRCWSVGLLAPWKASGQPADLPRCSGEAVAFGVLVVWVTGWSFHN